MFLSLYGKPENINDTDNGSDNKQTEEEQKKPTDDDAVKETTEYHDGAELADNVEDEIGTNVSGSFKPDVDNPTSNPNKEEANDDNKG